MGDEIERAGQDERAGKARPEPAMPSSRRITHGVVISPDSRYAFVSSEGIGAEMGTLDVVDLTTNEIAATVEIGLQTGGIAFWKMAP